MLAQRASKPLFLLGRAYDDERVAASELTRHHGRRWLQQDVAPSHWTSTPSRSSVPTPVSSANSVANGWTTGSSGTTAATSSSVPTAGRCTQRMAKLVQRAGLPPVRLHDLRHGAATLAHAAGADLKTIQDQLGHSTVVITADTYTSVRPTVQHRCAEATARLVLDEARKSRDTIVRKARISRQGAKKSDERPPTPTADTHKAPAQTASKPSNGSRRRSAHTRHTRGTHRPHRQR